MKLIILLLILSINCCPKVESKIEAANEHIEYYTGTKKVYCKYRTYKDKLVDTAFYFDSFGTIIAKHIYIGVKRKEEEIFESGNLKYKIDIFGVVKRYKGGKLVSIFRPKDSSYTFFYDNGSLKRYEKKCRGRVVYFNEYDSLTQKPTKFYRDVEENLEVINDSIVIRPYFHCNTLKMDDFEYSIIFFEGKGNLEKIYTQQSKSPTFKFKIKKGLSWTKKICDSIGCFSLPVSLKSEH